MVGGNPSPSLPNSSSVLSVLEVSTSISQQDGFSLEDFPILQRKEASSCAKGGFAIENQNTNQIRSISAAATENNKGLDSNITVASSSALNGVAGHKLGNPNFVNENLGVSASNPKVTPMDWRVTFPLPKPITPQPAMKYTPPAEVNGKVLVAAQSENFTEGIKQCEDWVVGFFVGERLSFAAVQAAVHKLWKFNKEVSITLHGDCAFIFKFKDNEDRLKVLQTGSFYISKSLFTLRPWSFLLEKSTSDIKTVPIWVLIFGVPLHMWNNDGLSLISSFLGKPLLADDCTLKQNRLAYARICIEIGTDFSYPSSIPLLIDGKIAMDLPVEYPWKPPLCTNCMVFGHVSKNCARSGKARWIPKKTRNAQVRPFSGDLEGDNASGATISPSLSKGGSGDSGTKDLDGTDSSIGVSEDVAQISTENIFATTRDSSNNTTKLGPSAKASSDEQKKTGGPVKPIDKPSVIGLGAVSSGAQVSNKGDTHLISCNNDAGAEVSGEYAQGEWIVAGKRNRKGSSVGGVTDSACNVGVKKTSELSSGKTFSPTKSGSKFSNGSGVGVATVAAEVKVQKILSPKRNPFMVYSDFIEDSRFPINKTKEMETKKVYTPARVVVERVPSAEKGGVEGVGKDNEDLNDCDFEKNLQCMSLEDQILKRKQREMHRLQWNGNGGSSSKEGGSSNQPLGRGLRSQAKKRLS